MGGTRLSAGGQYARGYPPRPPDNRFCQDRFRSNAQSLFTDVMVRRVILCQPAFYPAL